MEAEVCPAHSGQLAGVEHIREKSVDEAREIK